MCLGAFNGIKYFILKQQRKKEESQVEIAQEVFHFAAIVVLPLSLLVSVSHFPTALL